MLVSSVCGRFTVSCDLLGMCCGPSSRLNLERGADMPDFKVAKSVALSQLHCCFLYNYSAGDGRLIELLIVFICIYLDKIFPIIVI